MFWESQWKDRETESPSRGFRNSNLLKASLLTGMRVEVCKLKGLILEMHMLTDGLVVASLRGHGDTHHHHSIPGFQPQTVTSRLTSNSPPWLLQEIVAHPDCSVDLIGSRSVRSLSIEYARMILTLKLATFANPLHFAG